MSVVDDRLHLRGLAGLRAASVSLMPAIAPGNSDAPAITIGGMAAATIREDARASAAA